MMQFKPMPHCGDLVHDAVHTNWFGNADPYMRLYLALSMLTGLSLTGLVLLLQVATPSSPSVPGRQGTP